MAHNPVLADELGLSQKNRRLIDLIHEVLYELLDSARTGYDSDVYNLIEYYEKGLQELWGFPQDESKHTWKNIYKFRCQWGGRRWVCGSTGEVFEVPWGVRERDFFAWGEAFLDVGVLDGYYRASNCWEEDKCLD